MAYKILETCVFFPGVSRLECASWVQAWGTILAICAAICIAWWQRTEERRHARETELAKGLVIADTMLRTMVTASAQLAATGDLLQECKRGERVLVPSQFVWSLREIEMPTDEKLFGIVSCWPTAARHIVEARNSKNQALKLLEQLTRDGVIDEAKVAKDLPWITRLVFESYYFLIGAYKIIRPEDMREDEAPTSAQKPSPV